MAVVDAIVLVQKFSKNQSTIMNVKDLCQEQLTYLTGGFNEVIAVFGTYKADSKNKERTTIKIKASCQIPNNR